MGCSKDDCSCWCLQPSQRLCPGVLRSADRPQGSSRTLSCGAGERTGSADKKERKSKSLSISGGAEQETSRLERQVRDAKRVSARTLQMEDII